MPSRTRFSAVVIAAAVTVAACAPLGQRSMNLFSRGNRRELSANEQIAQVLSRLTFGALPGDVERVAAMGVDNWIRRQLTPASISDSVLNVAMVAFPAWTLPAVSLDQVPQQVVVARTMIAPPTDTIKRRLDSLRGVVVGPVNRAQFQAKFLPPINDQYFTGKIVRAQMSERQLEEVMSDFWANHFSVYSSKMPSRDGIAYMDRAAIRPHALGRFRDLLGAVAKSPEMLFYLDNFNSKRGGINENYARELLELHTLGVDGGYTQQDIIAVAGALTGWTLNTSSSPPISIGPSREFEFDKYMHDGTARTVLGHTLAAGRGIEDGEEVLDILARHPSTARYIATKLARRFVNDTPPPALVARAAATFTKTDGNITEVLRTIVTSPEFFSRSAFRSKVKTPFELVVSARRALNIPADTSVKIVRQLAQLGQPMWGRISPDGWPDDGAAWMNTGTILQRIRAGTDLVKGLDAKFYEQNPEWSALSTAPLERQVDGVVRLALGGVASRETRSALLSAKGEPEPRLKEMMALAFGSPEFQKR